MLPNSFKSLVIFLFVLSAVTSVAHGEDSVRPLYEVTSAESRSITAENPTGAHESGGKATEGLGKDAARNLGFGWKISPAIAIKAGQTAQLADIGSSGILRHIWMTPDVKAPASWRSLVIRMYWDGEADPSVAVPLGDFFASGLGSFAQINSIPVAVNPGAGFNSYWEMPFRKRARITVENLGKDDAVLYYQIDYTLENLSRSAAYFHASFHNDLKTAGSTPYVVMDAIKGSGQYVGTYMTYGISHPGWWGEGEIKFYIDGDKEFPTIIGTGTEDYFGGAWDFIPLAGLHRYQTFSAPYSGLPQIIPSEDTGSPMRFSLYRWHIPDPIRFKEGLRVTMQMLGWKPLVEGDSWEYAQLHEHVSSVAFWYQTEPHIPLPAIPSLRELETR